MVISYIPPVGKKATMVRASYGISGAGTCTLRNNGAVTDTGMTDAVGGDALQPITQAQFVASQNPALAQPLTQAQFAASQNPALVQPLTQAQFAASQNPPGYTEIEFLAAQAALGNLITISGTRTTTLGVIVGYIPASGKTFVAISADAILDALAGPGSYQPILYVNSVIICQSHMNYTTTDINMTPVYFSCRGASLVGNGTAEFSVYEANAMNAGDVAFANLLGYIK